MGAAVRLEQVTKRFGDLIVVNRISLTIEAGELFFLLGPSGCGKTTLLRSIAGFYFPDSGSIHIGDRDVTRLPPEERDTGMVFQSYALWPHMTVAENVAFGLELRKLPKDEIARRVADALAMVKMADRAEYKPNQLSGGQQQRVALARALVIRPKCLLLDEPLSNLDAKLRLEMRSEIRRICKQAGLTAIYVTHDQKEALSIADRIAVFDRGVIQQCDRPDVVYRRPANRFVANFIGETNFIEGVIEESQPGRAVVRTEIGRIVSTSLPSSGVSRGQSVTLSIRPETLHAGTTPEDPTNVFHGELHDTVYLGEMAQHAFQIRSPERNGDISVNVFELNPKIIAHDNERRATHVWVRPENVIVLTE
ncbi:MAG: ABC transporter ATP-binding protein [Kiritimatiellae bacterium]|nr:ABC transporter ATP-binding protein [Kiritimatiellia bacterium]MDW8458962.1 ABC transporter ATP-binding protein [Verrucomicrobiota bacterium]